MLSYTYISGTNKLQSVSDGANANTPAPGTPTYLGDFHYSASTGSAATYGYDANGNVTSDGNKNISSIAYNFLNLPQTITSGKGTISYTYDAAGNKLQKQTTEGSTVTTTLYMGGIVYQNDVLQFIPQEEGRIRVNSSSSGYIFDYYLKDHLGNTRMTITDDNTQATPIIDATSYYPFGLVMKWISYNTPGSLENKYKFNGNKLESREFSDGSGLEAYDANFRQRDAQTGKWWQLDPMMEAHPDISPYAFVNNNPILYADPLGLDTIKVFGEGAHKIKIAKGDVLAMYIQNTTSYYTYDPGNKDAVNGFVGSGVAQDDSRGGESSVTVTSQTKAHETYYSGLGIAGLGMGIEYAGGKMFSNAAKNWFDPQQWKTYSHRFYGNQYTIKQTTAKRISKGFKVVGYGIGLYQEAGILFNDDLSGRDKLIETGSNVYSTFGGMYGAAWGIGWEAGRMITQADWYNTNVRPKLQDAYRKLGIKIEGDPDMTWLNKLPDK